MLYFVFVTLHFSVELVRHYTLLFAHLYALTLAILAYPLVLYLEVK
ncbi:Uncharacterised protein [Streptococcus pneumoniae]|nr:Uncharacterised protein [Streptococcus pneumoniae]